MITILGPTASGKTTLVVKLALEFDGEVISADSRQVYRGMSIGTGKDLSEYIVEGKKVNYHLIDIVDPGCEYNLFEFRQDFLKAYAGIKSRGKIPFLCGGSGMYLESVLKNYQLNRWEPDNHFREALSKKSDTDLRELLFSLKTPHNTTDLLDRSRMIRAIQIGMAPAENKNIPAYPHPTDSLILGIYWERSALRERITQRLKARLEEGMIEEVNDLLKRGLTPGQIRFYGLEYRYVIDYLEKKMEYQEMFRLLNIAIHQFSKRQMTWFRKMERSGCKIHWIRGESSLEEKLRDAAMLINEKKIT